MESNQICSPSCKLCRSLGVRDYVMPCAECIESSYTHGYSRKVDIDEVCTCTQFRHCEVVHGGDWDWLARILGMSGPNGMYFCPFCLISLDDIKKGVPHSPFIMDESNGRSGYFDYFVRRSAEGLFHDWECYERSGKPRSSVQEFHNCEFEPLISKEGLVIDRVSLMSLHLGLGLGKNLLDEFETHAIEVDRQIRHFEGAPTIEMQNLLEKERELVQGKSQHESDLVFYKETHNIFQEDINEAKKENPSFFEKVNNAYVDKSRDAIECRKSVSDLRQEQICVEEHIKDLKKGIQTKIIAISEGRQLIEREKGLFQSRFDNAVEKLKLKRQVYHHGALVGNDVKKLMEKSSIKVLSNCFKPILVTSPSGETYQFSTHALRQRLRHFHQKLSAALEYTMLERPLCKHEVTFLTWRVFSLGNYVPTNFEDFNISRKFHILTHHAPEKAIRRGTIGMESEQCIEAMHVLVNKSQRMYATMQDRNERLKLSIKSQWMKSDPSIPDYSVAKKRRMKEE